LLIFQRPVLRFTRGFRLSAILFLWLRFLPLVGTSGGNTRK
jgi:hypothetical protein